MDSPTRGAPYAQSFPTASHSSRWRNHPLIMFIVPLVVLLVAPSLYNLVVSPSFAVRSYNEDQLQEIASLFEEIYTTFANMTFIPTHAIRRGPHSINASAIPCKRSAGVMRLMEIMPYVDAIDVDPVDEEGADWFLGGSFVDYRQPEHLVWSCDPIMAHDSWFQVTPDTVALTHWGTGGWNNDRTFVMLYDIKRNAFQVYDGDTLIQLFTEDDLRSQLSREFHMVDLFLHSQGNEVNSQFHGGLDWREKEWFDAPTLLKRILNGYQTLVRTPWETSNKESGWGVEKSVFKELLERNGWLANFDEDQFNIDVIRARHKGSDKGPAKAAYKAVEWLEGDPTDQFDQGVIGTLLNQITASEKNAAEAKSEDEKLRSTFLGQLAKWQLGREGIELVTALKDIKALCPDDVCVKDGDQILWDLLELEAAFEMWQSQDSDTLCTKQLSRFARIIPYDPSRHNHCVAKRNRETKWFSIAVEQASKEALEHCAIRECTLLALPTIEERLNAEITKLEKQIEQAKQSEKQMSTWEQDNLPPRDSSEDPDNLSKVRWIFEIFHGSVVNGSLRMREKIERLQDYYAKGDRYTLLKCFDDGHCGND